MLLYTHLSTARYLVPGGARCCRRCVRNRVIGVVGANTVEIWCHDKRRSWRGERRRESKTARVRVCVRQRRQGENQARTRQRCTGLFSYITTDTFLFVTRNRQVSNLVGWPRGGAEPGAQP